MFGAFTIEIGRNRRQALGADGALRWFGVSIDIEDLQRGENALRENEATLGETIDTSDVPNLGRSRRMARRMVRRIVATRSAKAITTADQPTAYQIALGRRSSAEGYCSTS